MKQSPHATTLELAHKAGISQKGVDWHIKRLKAQGKLKRVGGRKSGRWEVLS